VSFVSGLPTGRVSHPSTSPWDGMSTETRSIASSSRAGVRSHEAKKIMKEKMKLGDEVSLGAQARGPLATEQSLKAGALLP